MITLALIAAVIIVAAIIAIVAVLAGGIGFLLTFGDIIVAVIVLWLVIRLFVNKSSNHGNKKD